MYRSADLVSSDSTFPRLVITLILSRRVYAEPATSCDRVVKRGTYVWTTCPRLLPDSIVSQTPQPLIPAHGVNHEQLNSKLNEHVRTQVLTPQCPHLFNTTTYKTTHLLLHCYLQFWLILTKIPESNLLGNHYVSHLTLHNIRLQTSHISSENAASVTLHYKFSTGYLCNIPAKIYFLQLIPSTLNKKTVQYWL